MDLIERQAAIDAINHICPVDTEYDCTLLDRVDVRCVLSDLPSAQPNLQPTCNQLATDTISRRAAIDALRVAYWDDNIQSAKDDPCIVDAMTDWAIRQVKALPSAQLERKNGKWIGYDGDWLKTMCKCSECGAMIDINEKYRNFFCYHCGAKMER